MLTGLFREVEHDAIYKPSPRLKGVSKSLEMNEGSKDVLKTTKSFEEKFERLIRPDPLVEEKGKRWP